MPGPEARGHEAGPESSRESMIRMLRLLFTSVLFCSALFGTDYRVLSRVHTVYILGMSNGLDQFLANRLTSSGAAWVVLDPARADAVLTDRLDEIFWTWLNGRYPLESKVPAPAHRDDLRSKELTGVSGKVRGTVFLVDPKSRLVLWSCYHQAKKATADEMDHAAAQVAKHLKAGLGRK